MLPREIFSFIPLHAAFIDELRTVLSCINSIEYEIKHNGLSHKSVKNCRKYIERDLCLANQRMIRMAEQIIDYLKDEVKKLPSSKSCWSASSYIIESIFGVYKNRMADNPLHGITSFVLFLPLHTRIGTSDKVVPFDFKSRLEAVFMSDIDDWKKEKLPENLVHKRIKTLVA